MARLTEFFYRRRDRLIEQSQQDVPENISEQIHFMFSTGSGQRVAEWLIEGILITPSYVPGNQQGRCCDTAFHEGQRALVKLLLDERDSYNRPGPEVVTK